MLVCVCVWEEGWERVLKLGYSKCTSGHGAIVCGGLRGTINFGGHTLLKTGMVKNGIMGYNLKF